MCNTYIIKILYVSFGAKEHVLRKASSKVPGNSFPPRRTSNSDLLLRLTTFHNKPWSMEQFLTLFLLIVVYLSIYSIDSYQIRSSPCYTRRQILRNIRLNSNDDGKVPQIQVSYNNAANIPTVFHEVWRLDRRNQIQHGIMFPP